MVKRLTLAEALRLGATLKGPKPSKYRNKPTHQDGRRFASRAEARRDRELMLLEQGGVIGNLKRQVPFDLVVNGRKICRYVADWTYREAGRLVAEDRKGLSLPLFRIKWELCQALMPEITWRLTK